MSFLDNREVLYQQAPDLVVVVGDVNSTVATSLAAVKLGIKVAHLEAGLRSFDRTMPEEINRIVTDSISDYLWTPSIDGNRNLENEGIPSEKIKLVGNIMIDSLVKTKKDVETLDIYFRFDCSPKEYGLVTLHRPSNVDTMETLENLCDHLVSLSKKIPLIFPIHPRTSKKLAKFGIDSLSETDNIHLTDPLGYYDFMNLVINSKLVITDSGGVQEETTYLQIPCFTLRPNTERPITITQGSNLLCKPEDLYQMVSAVFDNAGKKYRIPDLWDGNTAQRLAQIIKNIKSENHKV